MKPLLFKSSGRATRVAYPKTGRIVVTEDKNYTREYAETARSLTITRGTVEIEVNVQEIASVLTPRALASKGGKAVHFNGLIKAKVVERAVVVKQEEVSPLRPNQRYKEQA